MVLKIILYIFGFVTILMLIITLIGLFLPKERIVTRKTIYPVNPEILYDIITDNTNWQYRRGLQDLIILKKEKEKEIWDEIAENGTTIRFSTRSKVPGSFYSFNMESKLFTGYWTASLEKKGNNMTVFTATEHIRIKNPFVKTLSYFFFDIKKLMENYQEDLMIRVKQLYPEEGSGS